MAVLFGLAYAVGVSVLSMLAFNWFFLPPTHTVSLRESENWVALAVYLLTAIVVSELAARARRRAADAEQREREASVLARASAALLQAEDVPSQIAVIADDAARALGVVGGRIELDSRRRPGANESALDLQAGSRHVGRLFLPAGAAVDPGTAARLLPALAGSSPWPSTASGSEPRRSRLRRPPERRRQDRSPALGQPRPTLADHGDPRPRRASRRGSLPKSEREELLARSGQMKRLDRLVGNLLELSRLEAGAALRRRTLDGGRSGRARAGHDRGRRGSGRRLLPNDIPPVEVDRAQLERALVNVIENAIRFSPRPSRSRLTRRSTGGEVFVRVTDRARVPRSERERVFEPFVRGRGGREQARARPGHRARLRRGQRRPVWVEPAGEGGTEFASRCPRSRVPAE